MARSKLFGEFLVDSGHISEAQLLDSLLEQVRQLPTWGEILRSKGWLQDHDLLNVFSTQARENLDFRVAAVKCGLWNPALDEQVERELQKLRVPLGHILIRKGILSLDQLSSLLSTYHSTSESSSDSPTKTECVVLPFVEGSRSDVARELPFTPDFSSVEGPVVSEYVELLNDDKRGEIEKTILQWELATGDALEESLRNMYREYHTIKGSARFLKAILTEKLIHQTEEILSLSTRFASRLDKSDFEKLTSVNLTVCDLIWDLRDSLNSAGTEEGFWSDNEKQQRYRTHFARLMEFHDELESRDYSVDLEAIKDAF